MPDGAPGPAAFYAHLLQKESTAVAPLQAEELFPANRYDEDRQQVDLRDVNSWRLRMHEVGTPELLEVHLVNAIAPYILNARLETPDGRDTGCGTSTSSMSARWKVSLYRTTKTGAASAGHEHGQGGVEYDDPHRCAGLLPRRHSHERRGYGLDNGRRSGHPRGAQGRNWVLRRRWTFIDGAARILDPIFSPGATAAPTSGVTSQGLTKAERSQNSRTPLLGRRLVKQLQEYARSPDHAP